MCILGDAIQPPIWTNPALSHLFRLRRIQANIRRSRENKLRRRFEYTPGSSSSLKSALDIWRQDIPLYVTENAPCGYLHPIWMTKLYNYSILILMEEKRSILEHDAAEDILSAVVEVCLNFRLLQEEGHVMCYTWSAVSFSFSKHHYKGVSTNWIKLIGAYSSSSSFVLASCFSISSGRRHLWEAMKRPSNRI